MLCVCLNLRRTQEKYVQLLGSCNRSAFSDPTVVSLNSTEPMQPIIIVSPSASALITMHNIKGFLEDAHFVPSQQAVASGGKVLEDTVAVNHRRQLGSTAAANAAPGKSASSSSSLGASGAADRTARYWVVDSVAALSKFGSSDVWDRVVCVMTTGQEWQFKPYKWSEPRELFHNGQAQLSLLWCEVVLTVLFCGLSLSSQRHPLPLEQRTHQRKHQKMERVHIEGQSRHRPLLETVESPRR